MDGHTESCRGAVSVFDGTAPLVRSFGSAAQERIDAVAGEADLPEVYDTERHPLYVACTRPRDRLLVTSMQPPSEFLGDLVAGWPGLSFNPSMRGSAKPTPHLADAMA